MVLETQQNPERDIPEYYNASGLKGTYVRVPTSEEIPYPVTMEPSLVVEFYSR
jgi:small subunit ribosomal protein S4